VGELELTHASGRKQKSLAIPDAVYRVFELLKMDGKPPETCGALIQNKDYCIT
jgi:hypothetical protein